MILLLRRECAAYAPQTDSPTFLQRSGRGNDPPGYEPIKPDSTAVEVFSGRQTGVQVPAG